MPHTNEPTDEPTETAPTPSGPGPAPAGPPASAPAPAFRPDGRELALAPAWITVARLSGLLRAGILSAVASVALSVASAAADELTLPAAAMAWVILTGLLAAPAIFWPAIAYRHRSYRFAEDGVHLRRGVFWRSQIAVPRSRVQHTDVSQGPLERMHGIATLTLHTAGNHYAAVSLPGLAHGEAVALRDFLLAARAAEAGDAV